jgi:hypothetical protein
MSLWEALLWTHYIKIPMLDCTFAVLTMQPSRSVTGIAQMGQGAIADRENDHLGKSDVGVILIRKLWREELQALADGKPLRQWRRPPEGLDLTSGAESVTV